MASFIETFVWLGDMDTEEKRAEVSCKFRGAERGTETIMWADRLTNEEVLRIGNEKRNILRAVVERKAKWKGHFWKEWLTH